MKFAIFLLCLLPLALGEKRFVLGIIGDPVPITPVSSMLINALSDEKQCEAECPKLFTQDIIDLGCDFACKGIQSLIKLVPHQVPATSST